MNGITARLIAVALFISLVLNVLAQQPLARIPANPEPIVVFQPDSTTLTIRLHGDERLSYTTTEDGYVIIQNEKGYYCYAKTISDGSLKASRRIAHDPNNRSRCEQRYLTKIATDTKLKKEIF